MTGYRANYYVADVGKVRRSFISRVCSRSPVHRGRFLAIFHASLAVERISREEPLQVVSRIDPCLPSRIREEESLLLVRRSFRYAT